jgi:Protein of unknown function (DUF2939)
MRVIRWILIVCVIVLLIYGVSPYFSFWRFTVTLRSGDNAAISSRVNFPTVRASLKRQLVARFAHETNRRGRWRTLGPTLIDAIVDAFVTPDGIAALLSDPEALKNLKSPREFRFAPGNIGRSLRVKYAFFFGLRSFVVERDGIKLRFHFTGSGWQLYDLDLGLTQEPR